MIKKLEINNFKSFEQVDLELNNFTLLAGKNSMGKTSVIQAIFAMIQNGNNPFRGEYMNIGKVNELQNAITGNGEIKIKLEYEINDSIEVVEKKLLKLRALLQRASRE